MTVCGSWWRRPISRRSSGKPASIWAMRSRPRTSSRICGHCRTASACSGTPIRYSTRVTPRPASVGEACTVVPFASCRFLLPRRATRQVAFGPACRCRPEGLQETWRNAGLRDHNVVVEVADTRGDLFEAVLDSEVPGVETNEGGVGEVAEVGVAAFGGEEDVSLAPEDDCLGLGGAQALLPCRVVRGVGAVVVEQVQLDAVRVLAGEEEQVHVPVVRADLRRVRVAGEVDGLDGVGLEECLEGCLGFGRPICPQDVADAVPRRGESLLVGVGVLDDLPLL